MYRRDAEFGKDTTHVHKTANFDLPLKKNRQKEYKLQPDGEPVYTCMTSDFFVDEADEWSDGYENVSIMCTCENQNQADIRLPFFLSLPIRHRSIIHEPMLEGINIEKHLATGKIESVTCGGESGDDARICDFAWILESMTQCVKYNVPFHFKQTGARFKKGNRVFLIEWKDQMMQAQKSGVDFSPITTK